MQAEDDRSTAFSGSDDYLVEYLELRKETEARHRDRIAAIQYQPPDWIVDAIGERPVEPQRRAAWDRIVDRAVQYRFQHDLGDDTSGLIGTAPPSWDIARRAAWMAAAPVSTPTSSSWPM